MHSQQLHTRPSRVQPSPCQCPPLHPRAAFLSITNLSGAFAQEKTWLWTGCHLRVISACHVETRFAARMLFLYLFFKAITCHCGHIYSPTRAKILNCVLLMGFLIQLLFHYLWLGKKVILLIPMMLTEIKA